jgi:type I restriction enzyme M protein
MVSLPGQLFYSTQIPVCLWFLARNKSGRDGSPSRPPLRDRRGQTLFIDSRKAGNLIDRVHRELTDDEIERVAETYHAWRGEKGSGKYEDIPGFCRSVKTDEIAKHGFVLTPGRYVGLEEVEEDEGVFEERMAELTKRLHNQIRESRQLEKRVTANLAKIGFGGDE